MPAPTDAAARPRVLMLADVPDWAFGSIAREVARHRSAGLAVTIDHAGRFRGDAPAMLRRCFLEEPFDVVHVFWRDDLRAMLRPLAIRRAAAAAGLGRTATVAAMCRPVVTTSVYDHLHLDDPEALASRAEALHFAHAYAVSSPVLDRLYRAEPGLPPPDAVLPDGVDTAHFAPGDRAPEGDGPLRVGWVGNSLWGESHGHRDAKGLRTVLRPAMARLEADGVAAELALADASERRRDRAEMAGYYRGLDVLVCASAVEGTPNPVLEAMASGVAVVSTDVGIVREALGPDGAPFVVERTPEAVAGALARLAGDRALLSAQKRMLHARAADWDWSRRTGGWDAFWDAARTRARDPRLARARRLRLEALAAGIVPENPLGRSLAGLLAASEAGAAETLRAQLVGRPRLRRFADRIRGRA
ncbi:glycosyltransferase family 4 protein [Jannaschia sp. W003]|uniref:glycosyltransferase family 4 protein n=1 Tax=Jannaschia sp. W003 TaxID=2867012 RepID=UPI0021A691B3|nr:glycosyltransferase family 4 protein [Jannaschia sp. W003]UWQ22957.1 glycosyltransferase family 4 protein [Jannaschia sp. W003]